jgi:hypothetical protein
MTQQDEVEIDGLRLVLTCSAYPEQYDVFKGDQQVAYLRLRGRLTVEMPDVGGDLVYSATPAGGGMFFDLERRHFLTKAVRAINERLKASKRYVVVNENALASSGQSVPRGWRCWLATYSTAARTGRMDPP